MRRCAVLCIVFTLIGTVNVQAEFRAGAAVVDITPPIGFPMWGYAARHADPSVGVLEPLKARALVLAAGTERIALVGLDLGRAPTRDVTERIRQQVRLAGITQIFLVGSHTHHGPVIELADWPDAKQPYVQTLEKKLVRVILDANQKLVPARIGVASAPTTRNRNRHSKRPDAPRDAELLVLRAETLSGAPIAHAVNFAAHPTMIEAKLNRFSPDYVGALCDTVEGETKVPCIFLQGAAGDLSPNPAELKRNYREFGAAVGKEVLTVISTIRPAVPASPELGSHFESFRFKARVDVRNPILRLAIDQAFFPELGAFYEREYRDGVQPQLAVALLNQEIGFVGFSGEFFCGHALRLRERARLKHVFVMGYCNDYQQYFPTIEACSEGGYGADAPMGMAEVGAGERMVDRALIKLYQLRQLIGD